MRRHPERDIRRRRRPPSSVSPTPTAVNQTHRDASAPSTGWLTSSGEGEFTGWRLAYEDPAIQQDDNDLAIEKDADAFVAPANRRRRQVLLVQATSLQNTPAGHGRPVQPVSLPPSGLASSVDRRKPAGVVPHSFGAPNQQTTSMSAQQSSTIPQIMFRAQPSAFRPAPNVPVESMRLIEIASKGAIVNQHLHRLTCAVLDDSSGKLDLGKACLIVDELSTTGANAPPSAAQLVYAIRIRLSGPREPNRIFLCFDLLEMCVKNLGLNFARFIDQELMDTIIKCFKMTSFRNRSLASQVNKSMHKLVSGLDTFGMPSDPRIHVMRQKILFLIQLWADAFMLHQDEVPVIHSAYRNLREKGIVFPNRDAKQKFFVKDAEESPAFDVSAYASSNVASGDALAQRPADRNRQQPSREPRNTPDPRFTVSVDDILALQGAVDLLSESSPKASRSDLKAAFRLVRLSVTPLRRYKAKLANVIENSTDDSVELQDYVETYSTLCALLSSAEAIVDKSRALNSGHTARDPIENDVSRSRSVPPASRAPQQLIEMLSPPPGSPSKAVAEETETAPKCIDLIDFTLDEPDNSQLVQQSGILEEALKLQNVDAVHGGKGDPPDASFVTNATTEDGSGKFDFGRSQSRETYENDKLPYSMGELSGIPVNASVRSTGIADFMSEAVIGEMCSGGFNVVGPHSSTSSISQLVVEDVFTFGTAAEVEAAPAMDEKYQDRNQEEPALWQSSNGKPLKVENRFSANKTDPLGSLWLEFAKS